MLHTTLHILFKIPVFIILFLFLLSCDTDFEINTDWEEITIVYGLLDKSKDVQYIKINKAFLNNGNEAHDIAKIKDSVYHYSEISVILEAFEGSEKKYEIPLSSEIKNNKSKGIFHNPDHLLYRTPDGYNPDERYIYKLIIKNTQTGDIIDAQTSLVAEASINLPRENSRIIRYNLDSRMIVEWRPNQNARFYDLIFRLNYEEMLKSDTANVSMKYADWTIFSQRLKSNTMQFQATVEEIFDVLNLIIPENNNVYRRAKNVELIIYAGGDELYNYIQVYRPSIGIVQKKPEYSNINNGYGLFSSRYHQVIEMSIATSFNDSLVSGNQMQTKGFIY